MRCARSPLQLKRCLLCSTVRVECYCILPDARISLNHLKGWSFVLMGEEQCLTTLVGHELYITVVRITQKHV
jgi:hypothetical protein